MMKEKLLALGIVGTVVTALCCFTPLAVIFLGAVGLSTLVGWLDIVLIPALVFFISLTAYGLYRKNKLK